MLLWAIVFFFIAIIAGLLGFTGIAAGAADIAKILFYTFLILFVVFLILGGWRRRVYKVVESFIERHSLVSNNHPP